MAVSAGMSGIMSSLVLVQAGLLTALLDAGFVRLQTVMAMPVIVVMSRIVFSPMGMNIFIHTTPHRVIRGVSDIGKDCTPPIPAVVIAGSGEGVFTARQDKNNDDKPH
jgi:hypothetical protein